MRNKGWPGARWDPQSGNASSVAVLASFGRLASRIGGAQQPLTRRRALRDGAIIAGIVWVVAQSAGLVGPFTDARAYWASGQIPWYSTAVGVPNAFTYSPAFGQMVGPFTLLPWPIFAGLWAVLLFGTLTWMSGRWLPLAIILPPVAFELFAGNIHILSPRP